MAIRTKKISDLSKIEATADSLILGVNGGTTGKIQLSDIAELVKSGIEIPETQKSEVTKADLTKVQDSVTKCEAIITTTKKATEELASKFTTMVYSQTQKNGSYETIHSTLESRCNTISEYVDGLPEKVKTLEKKVETLEGLVNNLIKFVHSLQGEGYLSLANIKKAAAEHCPCEQETHNGEQSEQPTE